MTSRYVLLYESAADRGARVRRGRPVRARGRRRALGDSRVEGGAAVATES